MYTEAGTYVAEYESQLDCDSTYILVLGFIEIDTDVSLTDGTLTASFDEDDATYQWIDCSDNSPIAGATEQSFTPEETGSYAVIISWEDCADTSSCTTVEVVGIKEGSLQSLKIYPNPTRDFFFVDMEGQGTMEVFDFTGKLVAVESLDGETKINTTTLISGTYTLRIIHSNGNVFHERIVIN